MVEERQNHDGDSFLKSLNKKSYNKGRLALKPQGFSIFAMVRDDHLSLVSKYVFSL